MHQVQLTLKNLSYTWHFLNNKIKNNALSDHLICYTMFSTSLFTWLEVFTQRVSEDNSLLFYARIFFVFCFKVNALAHSLPFFVSNRGYKVLGYPEIIIYALCWQTKLVLDCLERYLSGIPAIQIRPPKLTDRQSIWEWWVSEWAKVFHSIICCASRYLFNVCALFVFCTSFWQVHSMF